MIRQIFFFIMLIMSVLANAQEEKNVLFVGNSITYYNNMPQTFKSIADEKGNPVTISQHTPGGTGFIHHIENESLYQKIRQGVWDFVVLQAGSSESIGYSQTKEQTLVRAKKINDSIEKYNPCAKVLYYEISYGVWGNSAENLNTYNNTMDIIRTNVEFWADNTNAFFAPAGEAMRTAWNNDTDTLLWGSTGDIHPNAKGSYLIACTMYTSIFQQPSLGATFIPNGLTNQDAEFYQTLADNTVLNNLSDWRINTYQQHTDFSFETNNHQVNFNNLSTNCTSYEWDFGDGTTSNEENPTHEYAQAGTYEVTLTTYRNDCEETLKKEIALSLSVAEETLTDAINIYPNPFRNEIFIKGENIHRVKLYNAVGQLVNTQISKLNTHLYKVETRNLPKGVYFLEWNGRNKKIIKN